MSNIFPTNKRSILGRDNFDIFFDSIFPRTFGTSLAAPSYTTKKLEICANTPHAMSSRPGGQLPVGMVGRKCEVVSFSSHTGLHHLRELSSPSTSQRSLRDAGASVVALWCLVSAWRRRWQSGAGWLASWPLLGALQRVSSEGVWRSVGAGLRG